MLIAVVNLSSVTPHSQVQPYVDAQLHQLGYDLCPAWALHRPAMAVYPDLKSVPPKAQILALLDESDSDGALAYHYDQTGQAISRSFNKTLLDNGIPWESGASHEVCEMTVDPACNRQVQTDTGDTVALEVCDPVESEMYAVQGLYLSDFVTPAWFDPASPKGAITRHMHKTKPNLEPFELADGGYAIVNNQPVFGRAYPNWRMTTKISLLSRTARRMRLSRAH